jgi:asparagine synthase (glutamine-hydrolysing)
MCGICGQFNFENYQPVDPVHIERMTRAMAHRGPDDEGFYISGPVGLGFRRLSIIDLAGGHQPMSDDEQSVWVVFNGEIYNFPDLRAELESLGYFFRTKSDTEVIVHGYKHWGVDVLAHLNGMFGLAIWDKRNRRLMISRDRMGIKPLYYRQEPGRLIFSSEVRALLAGCKCRPQVDPVALNLFLRYRYTPSPLTMFQGIRKLAPGTRLVIENGTARLERWWNFRPVPFDPMPSVKQAEERLLELYRRAVKRHLISDVPLGLLLSGGLDSGLLLALMNEHGGPWKTFTVGFGKSFAADELDIAAHTASSLNAPNISVQVDRENFEASLAGVISKLEEPVAASSVVPMYHLCHLARAEVKAVFMGQGPDELFGGYRHHMGVRYGQYWRSSPKWIRVKLSKVLNCLPDNEALRRGLYSLDVPQRIKRYQHVFSVMPGKLVDGLFHDGTLPPDSGDRVLECWQDLGPLMENTDELGGLQFLEIRSSLPDELLMYADKLSMAHGLEVRVPYLDQEIVEYVERLSASFKVRYGSGKWLQRRVCRRFLPEKVTGRKKLGFGTPVNEWFRDSISGKMDSILYDDESLIYNHLRPGAVQRLAQEHKRGKCNNSKILFSLVLLEEWMRIYIGNLES